ncbi:MAG: type I restriction endonuclease [Desulfomicrobium escambiense]|nr:type I restriction endonuclease [Desulfomicrobium escambiense]
MDKAAGDTSKSLYDRNQAVYDLLRYGVKVQADAGENTETVWLIDWKQPEKNRLRHRRGGDGPGRRRQGQQQAPGRGALRQRHRARRAGAEALHGVRRPKASARTSTTRRRSSSSRSSRTVQFVMAGNDTEGLRYGTIEHAGEVLPDVEGGRGPTTALKLRPAPAAAVRQGALARADPRLRRCSTPASRSCCRAQPVFRRQGRAGRSSRGARAASSGTPRAAARASIMVLAGQVDPREHAPMPAC